MKKKNSKEFDSNMHRALIILLLLIKHTIHFMKQVE